jgi:hypothetical protein
MFALPVHVRRENAGKRDNRQMQNHHNTRNKCTKHILGSHKPRCRSQSCCNEKIKPPQNTKTHFRFTYVKRMRGSEKIDRYKIIIIPGTSCTKHNSRESKNSMQFTSCCNETIEPRRTKKNAFPETAGKPENRQIQNHNTRNKLHKVRFSGVRSLDAGHKIVVMRRSNPRRTEK